MCRYLFDAGNSQQVRLAAAALKGKVYILACQTAADADQSIISGVEAAVDTFRCKEEFRPLF
jgi:hypothetical protein